MSQEKLVYMVLTIVGAMALIILDIQSKHIETKTKFESHESQSIRKFTEIDANNNEVKREVIEHLKGH